MSSKQLKSILDNDLLDLQKLQLSVDKYAKHQSNLKVLLKRLIKIWEEDDLSRGILALNIIGKLLQKNQNYISLVGKTMFSGFVRSSRNANALTAGRINFMLNSVVEVYRSDLDEGYQHAFVFIRQMAIILRKAYGSVKEQQSVHNWQYFYSLKLWTRFIAKYGALHEPIASLRHPLVNIIIGTIRLSPSERWIPLRFNCVTLLHELSSLSMEDSSSTKEDADVNVLPMKTVFISTLPLLLDVFTIVDFNKSATRHSNVPFDLRLMLHYSPSQRADAGCAEATLSWLLDLVLEALALLATSPAFPDVTYPLVNVLHGFMKKCKNARFCQMFKKLNHAITEHNKFIQKERASIKTITNVNVIDNFRIRVGNMKLEKIPFAKYYVAHKADRQKYLQQLAETKKKQTEEIGPAEVEEGSSKADNSKPEEKSKKRKKTDDDDDDDSDEDSDDSDASYDYDDGTKVVHVSRKDSKKEGAEDSDDSADFDMEAALKEVEPMEDDAVSVATSLDQEDGDELSDFDLSEYEDSNPGEKKKQKRRNRHNTPVKEKLPEKPPKSKSSTKVKKNKAKKN